VVVGRRKRMRCGGVLRRSRYLREMPLLMASAMSLAPGSSISLPRRRGRRRRMMMMMRRKRSRREERKD